MFFSCADLEYVLGSVKCGGSEVGRKIHFLHGARGVPGDSEGKRVERSGGGDEVEEVACEDSLGDTRGDLADICSLGEVGRVGFGGGRLLASGPDEEVVVEVDACLDPLAEDKFAEVGRGGAVEGGESGGFEERVGSEVVRAVSATTVSPGEDVGEDGRGSMSG